jgi:hypothetical protein
LSSFGKLDNGDEYFIYDEVDGRFHGRLQLKAAFALLKENFRERFPRIVLEGAPGQGKSTITQYICQVHRMRLLGYSEAQQLIPQEHLDSEVRVPLRVDLRDYAIWLNGKNPFSADPIAAHPQNPSLESFLAAQIAHQSGGHAFDVSDLV